MRDDSSALVAKKVGKFLVIMLLLGICTFFALSGTAQTLIDLAHQVKGILPHASLPTLLSGDIPNNAANTSGSAGSLSATLGCGQFPALTGDATTSAGSCAH